MSLASKRSERDTIRCDEWILDIWYMRLHLVARVLNYVEFSPSHCLSSVASDNSQLKGLIMLLISIEFSDYALLLYRN